MDGSWSIELNVATTNKSIRGSAIVTLSSGRVVPMAVRGTYGKRVSRLRVSSASGGNFFVGLDAASNFKSVSGRFFGQRLFWHAQP